MEHLIKRAFMHFTRYDKTWQGHYDKGNICCKKVVDVKNAVIIEMHLGVKHIA